jgi:hypothetical protein
MKKIKIVVMAISVLFLVSCESSTVQDISVAVKNPTYDANVREVMTSKCTGCHSNGNQFPNLSSYSEVRDATETGNLLCSLDASCSSGVRRMPDGGEALPENTINMIKLWAEKGYKEN